MDGFTSVTIDFATSHLVFPKIVACILGVLGIAILIRDRKTIAGARAHWSRIFKRMDKFRFFGTLALTLAYFGLMIPIGNIWPNTGMGFLICSIVFVFLAGLLFMHERTKSQTIPVAFVAVVCPTFVWWLFTYPLFLTLP